MSDGVRLRPLVEVVEDAEGALYLLRGPAGGDCVIRDAPAPARSLLRALERGGPPPELAERVRADGHAVSEREVGLMLEDLRRAQLTEPLRPFDVEARLSRQLLYLGSAVADGLDPEELQQRITAARVTILGCGGLGSWAATGLACIGVGAITLVDDDVVELSNLNRQLLFREQDLGRSKVHAAADALRAFDSALDVTPVHRTLAGEHDVRAAIEGASFVVGCADRPPYAIARWVNRACAAAGVAHITAGQLPPIVRVGPLVVPGTTACAECLERALREENPLYERLEALRTRVAKPLATLGPASGIIGQAIASEVLHFVTGLVEPATLGSVWTLDLRTLAAERTPVARRADCRTCPR